MESIFIVGISCLFIYGIIKLNKDSKEKAMLIQAGFDPTLKSEKNKHYSNLSLLKWGIIFSGVGLGLFVAEMFYQLFTFDKDAMYIGMILIFGGISFIISHIVVIQQLKNRDSEKKENSSQE